MSDLVGTLLGPYRILSRIGQGGMGTVFKAFRPGLERLVAIKVLSQGWEADSSFVERFRQETRLITQLEHHAIVPVYDVGEHEHHLYLVMRYLQAGTARDILHHGLLPVADAAQIVTAIASALDYAHTHSIIHRDVKPSNILIDKQGHAYLTDFGMAKAILTSTEITRTGDSVGTPAYMAPEQAMGRAVAPETDVYALGVTLYEMVAGRVPFQSEMPIVQAMLHVHSVPPSPRAFNPNLSEGVEGVILKALAKNPLDRFHSAGAFASALNAVVAQESLTQRPVLTELAGAIAADKGAEEITPDLRLELQRRERGERWRHLRRPLMRWGLAGVLLALVLSLLLAGNEIMRERGAIAQTATALVNLLGQLSAAQTAVAGGGGNDSLATLQYLQTQITAGQIMSTLTPKDVLDSTETSTRLPSVTVTPRPTSTQGQAPTRTRSSVATLTPTPNNSTNATPTPPGSDLPPATLGPSQTPLLAPTHTATHTLPPPLNTPTLTSPEPPDTATMPPSPTPTTSPLCLIPPLCSPTPSVMP